MSSKSFLISNFSGPEKINMSRKENVYLRNELKTEESCTDRKTDRHMKTNRCSTDYCNTNTKQHANGDLVSK